MQADSSRAPVLAAGLGGLLALRALDHSRFAAQSLVSLALGVGPDAAVLYVGVVAAGVAAVSWGALSAWGLTSGALRGRRGGPPRWRTASTTS